MIKNGNYASTKIQARRWIGNANYREADRFYLQSSMFRHELDMSPQGHKILKVTLKIFSTMTKLHFRYHLPSRRNRLLSASDEWSTPCTTSSVQASQSTLRSKSSIDNVGQLGGSSPQQFSLRLCHHPPRRLIRHHLRNRN
jgi:hypothetical protein